MDIKTYEVKTDKLKASERPLRLVLLADLHNRLWGEKQKNLLEAIDGLQGDMILCAGDMILGKEQVSAENTIELFRGLAKRRIPMYYANGNHESRVRQMLSIYGKQYLQYARQLRDFGVQLLENETAVTRYGSMQVKIHGYELPLVYYRKLNRLPYDTRDLRQKLGRTGDGAYHILLAHNPVYFDTYVRWGADLTLSGHLHGGVIRIPGIGGLISPQVKLFPKFDRGLFEENGKYMVVSAGLGEHTIPIRIFNPNELVCVEVKGTG